MKIAIAQLDGKIPNLALMKVAGYHERRGDSVSRYEGALFAGQYDKIYFSKLFSFTPMPVLPHNAVIGGTGIDFYNILPPEVENAEVSFSLYNQRWRPLFGMKKGKWVDPCNYHIGFSMKGCRFACKFCCVPKKEGRPYNYNSIDEILVNPNGGNRLMLLDNDFFGGENWRENLMRIIELKLRVCFVQGLNIRIITPEQAMLLAKCNYQNSHFDQKYLTFAWDKYKDRTLVENGIRICNNAGIPTRHMQFFVLIGFDTTHEQNMERVMLLRELGAMPFVMPYNLSDPYQRSFARWVNHRATFKQCKWEEYKWKVA